MEHQQRVKLTSMMSWLQIAWSAPAHARVSGDRWLKKYLTFHQVLSENAWEEAGLHALCSSSGLSGLRKSRVKTLGSGQRQRLRLHTHAMGTLQAGLVILDEPLQYPGFNRNNMVWRRTTLN